MPEKQNATVPASTTSPATATVTEPGKGTMQQLLQWFQGQIQRLAVIIYHKTPNRLRFQIKRFMIMPPLMQFTVFCTCGDAALNAEPVSSRRERRE